MDNKDFETFQNMLEKKINFSFIKMNEGEINCIINKSCLSRGKQDYNEELANELQNALTYGNNDFVKNYFVGIPCKKCYPKLNEYAVKNVKNPVNANLLINSNFNKTYSMLKELLKDRIITLVCNENADTSKLPFNPKITLKVSENNSWNIYKYYKDCYNIIPENTVAIFCCGPLGRVLAYEWYKNHKNITCLELGSFYDPWTLGKAYMYHTGVLQECSECNPTYSEPISDSIINNAKNLERYYWENYSNDIINPFYNSDPRKLRQYYLICSKNIENKKLKYYCEYIFYYYDFQINQPDDSVIENVLNDFIDRYPNRAEAVFELKNFFKSSLKKVEYMLKIKDIPEPSNEEEFVDRSLYRWKILDSIVISAYYENMYKVSEKCWEELMLKKDLIPEGQLTRCIDNGRYAKMILNEKNSYNMFLYELNNISEKLEIITDKIPKIFHFIFISGDHKYVMAHYLAIKTCFEINKPEKIFMWYNDPQNILENNKWWKLIGYYATFIKITIPTILNNKSVIYKQHQADIMRINILNKIGGVYMDIDILSLNPLDGSIKEPQFEYSKISDINLFNHEFVIGKETDVKLCNCVIMSKSNHPFLKKWIESYENEYGTLEEWWTGLSVTRPWELFKSNKDFNITILKTKEFLPFMFCDDTLFRKNHPEIIKDSLTLHLWDTESFKYGWIPEDENYFENFPNTLFTDLFKKYI
jgi:hypothetical protein